MCRANTHAAYLLHRTPAARKGVSVLAAGPSAASLPPNLPRPCRLLERASRKQPCVWTRPDPIAHWSSPTRGKRTQVLGKHRRREPRCEASQPQRSACLRFKLYQRPARSRKSKAIAVRRHAALKARPTHHLPREMARAVPAKRAPQRREAYCRRCTVVGAALSRLWVTEVELPEKKGRTLVRPRKRSHDRGDRDRAVSTEN